MLVTLSEILQLAEAKKCAVGSFNTPNLESIMAVIGAAEELNVPVIIMHAEVHEPMMPISVIGPIMIERAKAAKVPVCVHLDHGETLAYLDQALNIGFTSVSQSLHRSSHRKEQIHSIPEVSLLLHLPEPPQEVRRTSVDQRPDPPARVLLCLCNQILLQIPGCDMRLPESGP